MESGIPPLVFGETEMDMEKVVVIQFTVYQLLWALAIMESLALSHYFIRHNLGMLCVMLLWVGLAVIYYGPLGEVRFGVVLFFIPRLYFYTAIVEICVHRRLKRL